ncbi:YbaN family protein [Weissella paramesenteroides]|uniref:YbaN family protein n=1 Tax=Weissella paramesenteroides TaxID=1249 RepID=UPI0020732F1F|nr:YbaN family protein [Weissella paramesenteroides]MCM6765023.1 YbaN family protein [Weissella paramesenteroides]MCM6767868.1 YbaN family protein [Weissella paramesenteroides]MCM6768859.1 YbaN family protein [Weissella paramesenteroides]MCM6770962.1 YbaN family protein [Weissella paramesenteroides]MCM6780883.1 YbaN family protein [Weissella paramesenteroides]
MRFIYIILGLITFGIGTLTIWVPGIPTTPFYLLTAFFWGRSSTRLQIWLESNKYYQQYVYKGIYKRQLTQKNRIIIYLVTAAFMGIPFFTSGKLWLQITLICASFSQIIAMEGFYRGWWLNNWFLDEED